MIKTFKIGGVHPEENKLSADKPIQVMPLPKFVVIPVSQHIGSPANPIVNKGDKVKAGQLIAEASSFISANIHASVSGTVTKIDDTVDASGYRRKAIFIDVEGDEWMEGIDTSQTIVSEIRLTREEIIDCVKLKGIVGMGGATFPTNVKLNVPEGKKAEFLLVNGVECEPYLTEDYRIMLERGQEVLVGIRILMKALDVRKAYIGIEKNKPDAIQYLTELCKSINDIEVVPLKVKYPQGGEKQLIKAVTGREVPSGKLPIDVACVVQNVSTALAVYEAVQKNKPLVERIVTVTGKNVSNPCNLQVRIGTLVSSLIEFAGGLPADYGKVINGGPMMGKALTTVDVPVVKGTSGILIMSGTEARRKQEYNCVRCGRCVTVCPMGLEPYLIAQMTESGNIELTEYEHVMNCIECGSCAYTCPSGRPLLDNLRLSKNKVGQLIRTRVNK